MSAFDITVVGVRLLGVWLVVQALASSATATAILVALSEGNPGGVGMAYATTGFVLGVAGLLFLRFSVGIARLLVQHREYQGEKLSFQYERLQSLGFVLLGAYLLSVSLPDLIRDVLHYFELGRHNPHGHFDLRRAEIRLDVIAAVLQMVIGCTLVFGTSGLVRLIDRLRRAGVVDREA